MLSQEDVPGGIGAVDLVTVGTQRGGVRVRDVPAPAYRGRLMD